MAIPKKKKPLSTVRTSSTKFELLVPPINGKMSCDLFWRVARCLGKDEKTLNAMQMIIIVFQPHNPAPSAMQVDPSFKVFMRKIYCSSSYHSKIHLPEYQVFYSLWHFSECNVNLLKDKLQRRRSCFADLKDGAYYCYCAYVLRISRYSDFLSVMLTNTVIFLRGLKLSGKSRS